MTLLQIAAMTAFLSQPIAETNVNTTPIKWGPGRLWTAKLTKVETDHYGMLWLTWKVTNNHRRLAMNQVGAYCRVVNEDIYVVNSQETMAPRIKPRAEDTIRTNVKLAPGDRTHLMARTVIWVVSEHCGSRRTMIGINYELRYKGGRWDVVRQGRYNPTQNKPWLPKLEDYEVQTNPMLAHWARRYYDPTK